MWLVYPAALSSHGGSPETYGSLDTNDHSGCQLHPSASRRPPLFRVANCRWQPAIFVLMSCFCGAFVWFGGHSARDVPAVHLAATGQSSHIEANSWFVRPAGWIGLANGQAAKL